MSELRQPGGISIEQSTYSALLYKVMFGLLMQVIGAHITAGEEVYRGFSHFPADSATFQHLPFSSIGLVYFTLLRADATSKGHKS